MSGDFPGRSCWAVQSFRIGSSGVTVVADLVVQQDALNHWLKEEVEYVGVKLEVPHIPLVGLLLARFHAGCPLQIIVDHWTQIFVVPYDTDFFSFDHK